MREKLNTLPLNELKELAKAKGLKGISSLRKAELIDLLCQPEEGEVKETVKRDEAKPAPQAEAASSPAAPASSSVAPASSSVAPASSSVAPTAEPQGVKRENSREIPGGRQGSRSENRQIRIVTRHENREVIRTREGMGAVRRLPPEILRQGIRKQETRRADRRIPGEERREALRIEILKGGTGIPGVRKQGILRQGILRQGTRKQGIRRAGRRRLEVQSPEEQRQEELSRWCGKLPGRMAGMQR